MEIAAVYRFTVSESDWDGLVAWMDAQDIEGLTRTDDPETFTIELAGTTELNP